MMNENVLTLYLKTYLEELGRDKESFFITITDFEQELLEFLNMDQFPEYSMAVVSINDYASAVALRNDPSVQKIVLFTEDCTRKIDSLKDFQEYPFIPGESSLFWKCVKRACGFDADDLRCKFVDLLRKEKKILAIDLFEYLLQSVENNKLSILALNEHMDMFHCFRSTNPEQVSLSIPKLKKKIRNSDVEIIEKQLRPAIADGSLRLTKTKTSQLIKALNDGDYQKIYETVDYDDDGLEKAFKQTFRRRLPAKKDIEEEMIQYQYSYEALLKEEGEMLIEELEQNINKALVKQDEDDIIKLLFEQAANSYVISENEYNMVDDKIAEILSVAEAMKLNRTNEEFLIQKLVQLRIEWEKMRREEKKRAKPYLLNAYCDSQQEFLEIYFDLMKYVVINNSVLETSLGETFYEKLQVLFCDEEDNTIRMPFYHPVMGFYYMYLREIFRQAIRDIDHQDVLLKEVVLTMVEKKKAFFPIRFLSYMGNLYEIDCEDAYGKNKMLFYNVGTGIPDYQIEFSMFNKYILNYIKNHSYQPELFIAIVDIGELKGIDKLFRGLSKVTDASDYVLNRVTIHIISRNESEMKRALEFYEDSLSNFPSIRFKFSARNQGEGVQAQLQDIVRNADIVILADSEYLYEKPRLIPYTQNPNGFIAWIEGADSRQFLERYKEGDNRFNVLWETMHNAIRNASNNLSVWSYREIKQRTFRFFDEAVDHYPELEIIVLSSNVGLMRMIYQSEYYSARVDRSKGQDVLVLDYNKNNHRNHFSSNRHMDIQLPLDHLLYDIINEKELVNLLPEHVRKFIDRVVLRINLGKSMIFGYGIIADKMSRQEEDWEEIKEQFGELLNSVLEYAFLKEGILAKQLKEMILRECYQMVDSYEQALGVYYLSQMKMAKWQSIVYTEAEEFVDELRDCMESIELNRIMQYLSTCQKIDGSSITRFNRYYNAFVLNNIVKADEKTGFLPEKMKENAVQILKQQ